MNRAFHFRPFAVSQGNKPRLISELEPLCYRRSISRSSVSVAGVFMTWLTWTDGLRNISSVGGLERKLYGP
jgi:hypothetical protein